MFQRLQQDDISADAQTPVHKVVDLIHVLRNKATGEAKVEQQSYDKYACWCEDALARKARSIAEAKETIEKLDAEIPQAGARVASLEVEISQAKKDIGANEQSQREAAEVRNSENAAYAEQRTEAESCMGALEAAIKTLAGAGAAKAFLDTTRQAQLLSAVVEVRRVLTKTAAAQHAASPGDIEALRRFVEASASLSKPGSSELQLAGAEGQGNNPFGDYAPHSTQIQGILKGMYDSFAGELEQANAAEAQQQKAFEELMATKTDELNELKATLAKHEDERAEQGELLADGKSDRDEAKAQLKADEEFFVTTKRGCQQKAEDWSRRTLLRSQELNGIDEALAILGNPDNAETLGRSTVSLAQVSSHVALASSRAAASKAYDRLRDLAARYESLRLARVAVKAHSAGHFNQVMVTIDQMISELREEEQSDIQHRDRCQNAAQKNENDKEDLKHAIGKADEFLARLDGAAHAAYVQAFQINAEIEDTEGELAEMLSMRNRESKEFAEDLKDDTEAVDTLERAIAAMSKFYKRDKEASLVQERASDAPGPIYTIDPDKAPETTWSGGEYGGEKSLASGALGALETLVDDIKGDMNAARRQEADAQADYEDSRAKSRTLLDALRRRHAEAKMKEAELREALGDQEAKKLGLKEEIAEQEELASRLNHDCSWVDTHFESRRKHRKEEIEGLQQAKSMLAGAEEGDFDELAVAEAAG